MKLNIVFDAIDQVEWDVPNFLAQLFQKEKVDERHERVVKAMLNGTTKPYLGTIEHTDLKLKICPAISELSLSLAG